jgi:hypothetical protein
MNSAPIIESGMNFGPEDDCCFYIEKSQAYQSIRNNRIPMAELWLLRTNPKKALVIWIVEAKSGAPQPQKQEDFDEFIGKVRDKLANALMLGVALYLNRHGDSQTLPEKFRSLAWSQVQFRLALIINGRSEGWQTGEWLIPLQDSLRKELQPLAKIWSLQPSSVVVLNAELAREHGLIARDLPLT